MGISPRIEDPVKTYKFEWELQKEDLVIAQKLQI